MCNIRDRRETIFQLYIYTVNLLKIQHVSTNNPFRNFEEERLFYTYHIPTQRSLPQIYTQ